MSEEWRGIVGVLEKLTRFFAHLGRPALGEYFQEIVQQIHQGKLDEATCELTSTRLWGGAGSYVDRVLYPEEGFAFEPKEFGQVNAIYCALLLELLQQVAQVAPQDWMAAKVEVLQGLIASYEQMATVEEQG